MDSKKFVEGLRVFKPSDKAPDFIIANAVLHRKELIVWLQAQDGEQIKVDFKRSKEGKYYCEINNYQATGAAPAPQRTRETMPAQQSHEDDLPFWMLTQLAAKEDFTPALLNLMKPNKSKWAAHQQNQQENSQAPD